MDKLLIVTDAWHPQVNGVVRSLERVGDELRARGMDVHYLTPERFWTMPLPTYPEIRLSLAGQGAVSAQLDAIDPDYIHIATEGPLGHVARRICLARGLAFSTSYHTRFPEYLAARLPVPAEWSYNYLRWFHGPAAVTMVPTRSVLKDLRRHKFRHLALWSRGVDADRFAPGPKSMFTSLPGPHLVCVGRVAVEKNVSAFLDLDVPGTKIVVGDGPQLEDLRRAYPEVIFTGRLTGEALSAAYRSADVFVFPSRTDTFGNVMIEAMACGTPVAAYPVTGPVDVLTDPASGVMDEDLGGAVLKALTLSREAARAHALRFTWANAADQFSGHLVSARAAIRHAA
ncbi:glycosyltransferase family 4 protein [Pelagibacterium xiamenense]|uniref:glycosyltransferase family 4 protein n=1 Tax=Pelagibacterium xiamenense TaxID=2901140 RepID=UPI001E2CE472|nr:glycosyltransferase family 1 protein [Pelagibacterium xiamenense]MCD7060053.1 glycosyltransferase family 1 protein [Pelagibacterium xiamenense]